MHLLTTLRNTVIKAEAQLKNFFAADDEFMTTPPHPVIDAQAEFMKATHDAIANLTNRVAVLEDGAHASKPYPILAAGNLGAGVALENSDPAGAVPVFGTAPAPGIDAPK